MILFVCLLVCLFISFACDVVVRCGVLNDAGRGVFQKRADPGGGLCFDGVGGVAAMVSRLIHPWTL